LYEADNNKDLSILDELISPDFFDPTFQLRGPEGDKRFETEFFEGFLDWQETIEDMVAEGDKVWVRFTAEGTHKGEWRGLAPRALSGHTVHVLGFAVVTNPLDQIIPNTVCSKSIETKANRTVFLLIIDNYHILLLLHLKSVQSGIKFFGKIFYEQNLW
jgi:predicted ester cyclase